MYTAKTRVLYLLFCFLNLGFILCSRRINIFLCQARLIAVLHRLPAVTRHTLLLHLFPNKVSPNPFLILFDRTYNGSVFFRCVMQSAYLLKHKDMTTISHNKGTLCTIISNLSAVGFMACQSKSMYIYSLTNGLLSSVKFLLVCYFYHISFQAIAYCECKIMNI